MEKDDFKLYSLIVGEGSGCFFQPMTTDYSYILTAKHVLFEKKIDDRGKEYFQELVDGTSIEIYKQIKSNDTWEEKEIPFILKKNENYFPHKTADVAILKIPYEEGIDKIFIAEEKRVDYYISGFPGRFKENKIGERHVLYRVRDFLQSGDKCRFIQLDTVLDKKDIDGLSGGGILALTDKYIEIIGIQSRMITEYESNGQVGYVSMKYFNEIVNEWKDQLQPLFPPYLKSFSYLIHDIFELKCQIRSRRKGEKVTKILKCKANVILETEVTPLTIKACLEKNGMISSVEMLKKGLWCKWLELLTILNIRGIPIINEECLIEVLKKIRLIYSDIEDDFWCKHLRDLCKFNYSGLKKNGVVVVATNVKADEEHILDLNGIPQDIAEIREDFECKRLGNKIDCALDFPFDKYRFMNISAFKEYAVDSMEENFIDQKIDECVKKLKEFYQKLLPDERLD